MGGVGGRRTLSTCTAASAMWSATSTRMFSMLDVSGSSWRTCHRRSRDCTPSSRTSPRASTRLPGADSRGRDGLAVGRTKFHVRQGSHTRGLTPVREHRPSTWDRAANRRSCLSVDPAAGRHLAAHTPHSRRSSTRISVERPPHRWDSHRQAPCSLDTRGATLRRLWRRQASTRARGQRHPAPLSRPFPTTTSSCYLPGDDHRASTSRVASHWPPRDQCP